MQDLRDKMLQALFSSAPFISDAVMEYVSKLEAQAATTERQRDIALEKMGLFQDAYARLFMTAHDAAAVELVMTVKLRQKEAHLAAMREALEECRDSVSPLDEYSVSTIDQQYISAALAPDAGKALLERLRKAEAERVEAYTPKTFCQKKCLHWVPELYGCNPQTKKCCTAAALHDYQRAHNMIREAE